MITIIIDGWVYWIAITALLMNILNDGLGLVNRYLGKKIFDRKLKAAVVEALSK